MSTSINNMNKLFMNKEKEFQELSNVEKSSMYFILNRFMSITHPFMAVKLNRIRINSLEVVNFFNFLENPIEFIFIGY